MTLKLHPRDGSLEEHFGEKDLILILQRYLLGQ
jgi:hypothetical protein